MNGAAYPLTAHCTQLFFRLVRISCLRADRFEVPPTATEWQALFELARRQALVGLLFSGIERLPAAQRPPRELLLQWYTLTAQIEQRNRRMNERCRQVSERLGRDGFRSCILKGQGLAQLYPQPLRRQSGDIDIWTDGAPLAVLRHVRRIRPHAPFIYHHVELDVVADTEIEVHYRPSWMNNPRRNCRLQRWFGSQRPQCMANRTELGFAVPTPEFNSVYVLLHIYRHLFDEGVGMRQLADYFFVLRQRAADDALRTSPDCGELEPTLASLGLLTFARAVMWLMGEVFGLSRNEMPVAPDERGGRFLLGEVLMAGNFGHYDDRNRPAEGEGLLRRFVRRQRRNLRFLRSYPSEILWSPFFTLYQRMWRIVVAWWL